MKINPQMTEYQASTTSFLTWLISFLSLSSSSLDFPSSTFFAFDILSWTDVKPSRNSRFAFASSSWWCRVWVSSRCRIRVSTFCNDKFNSRKNLYRRYICICYQYIITDKQRKKKIQLFRTIMNKWGINTKWIFDNYHILWNFTFSFIKTVKGKQNPY